ncbi:hypothetical protein ABPG72_002827 [Tetrahymena utriculariae]
MNFLVSKLSGLRVLCGETINNCFPIHKLFQQDTEQNLEEDGQQRQAQEDGFQQSSIERQINKQHVLIEDQEEEEERKHFNEESSKNTYTNSKSEYEMQQNNFVDKDQYDIPFNAMNNMSNQNQNIFEVPTNVVNAQSKASKKPMLGMIDEDKIQKAEKNDPVDEVDYFSQMNMGAPNTENSSKNAVKQFKKASKKKAQEVKPDDLFQDQQQVQSQFNKINDDIAAEEVEGAAWGANDDDIDL